MQFVSLVATRLIRLLIHEHDGETRLTTIPGMAKCRTSSLQCRKIVLSMIYFELSSKGITAVGPKRGNAVMPRCAML